MFGRISGALKASEAGVIIKEALRALPVSPLPFDPDFVGTRLVAISVAATPHVFEGKEAKPPHPVSTAAISLAGALGPQNDDLSDLQRKCLFLALGNVLRTATELASRNAFLGIDRRLIELATTAYLKEEEATREQTGAIVGSLGL